MRILLSTLAAVCCVSIAIAQEAPEPGHGLPIGLSPEEIHLIPGYRASRASDGRGVTTPPSFIPRTMAEWEEIQSLCITWTSYEGILKQIVRAAKEECEVIILCDDQATVIAYLNNTQFGGPLNNLNNITFIEGPFDSVWMRDYGAESMYENEVDSLYLMDWIYNRPRPDDDASPDLIAAEKNIAIFNSTNAPNDMVHTGGNFMADGFGTAFSSNLVIDENGANGDYNVTTHSPAQVDALISQWMGITNYVRMTTLPYDGIHHIDMHMKLIDEERLLVGEFPVGVSDGPQLETNLGVIAASETSVFGSPYEFIRVPMIPTTAGLYPPNGSYRTYANNVFVNKTVIVPTYREEYDTTGLRILQEALPGYRIVPIDCDNSGQNIISASGAIHCITKGIGVNDPLLIKHQALDDTYETVVPYTVEAYIRHKTGITGAELYWTIDTAAGFTSVPMTDIGSNNWGANIPAQAVGSTVFYYVHATATNGKEQVRPITAPDGWWKFRVLDINSGILESAELFGDIFPNPVSQILAIGVHDSRVPVEVMLCDALGRTVINVHNGPMSGRYVYADVRGLDAGTYFVIAESANGREVRKVVKK